MTKTQENLVEHLLRKSRLFKDECSVPYRVIKSSLANQSLEVAPESELNLSLFKSKNVFKICQWCLCYWKNGLYSFKIEPQKRPSKFIRSLLNKDVEALTEMQLKQREKYTEPRNRMLLMYKDVEALTEMQLKQREKYTEPRNRMVLKCRVCNKETKVPLKKPDPISVKANSVEQKSPPTKSKKKKKKKKDSCAGLKSEAIMKCKVASIDKQSTLVGPENTNSSNTSNDMKTPNTILSKTAEPKISISNIQNKPIKKKKKIKIGKLKNIFKKEKKSNASTAPVSNKKNSNSLLSAFLTSL